MLKQKTEIKTLKSQTEILIALTIHHGCSSLLTAESLTLSDDNTITAGPNGAVTASNDAWVTTSVWLSRTETSTTCGGHLEACSC